MKKINLSCKNHKHLRWNIKEIGFTKFKSKVYLSRNIFFIGNTKNPLETMDFKKPNISTMDLIGCNCSINLLYKVK